MQGEVLIKESISDLKRQRKEIDEKLAKLEEVETKRKRCNNEVEEAICLLRNEYLSLDEIADKYDNETVVGNKDFWLAFLKIKDELPPLSGVWEVFDSYEPQEVMKDKELMVQLCAYDANIYATVYACEYPWSNDEELIKAVLTSSPYYLRHLPHEIQMEHPLLVGAALSRLPLSATNIRREIMDSMNIRLWLNRDVVLGWVKGGGGFHEILPPRFRSERAISLELVRNVSVEVPDVRLSSELSEDKEFMIQAVERNPVCITQAAGALIGDLDLVLMALSNPFGVVLYDELPRCWFAVSVCRFITDAGSWEQRSRFWFGIGKMVRDKLQSHDVFVKLILINSTYCAHVAVDDDKIAPSPFSILNQGEATALSAYMKPTAEYVGVPMGAELRRLRSARQTLALMGIHWTDPKV